MGDEHALAQGQVLQLLQGSPRRVVGARRPHQKRLHPCAPPADGRVEPARHGVGEDGERGHAVVDQGQGDGPVAVGGHVVEGPVDGVEHPGPPAVGLEVLDAVRLLAVDGDTSGLQVTGDALLDAAVDLGDQVVAVRLGLDAQLLTRVQGEGGRLADRSHPAGEQLLQAGRRRRPDRRLRCH